MSVIENFATLSVQEQRDFAEALVKTINSENTFTDQVDFKVTGIDADEITGGLIIMLEHKDTIEVKREAIWACLDRDDANSTPDDPDFIESISDDTEKAFKTLTAKLEGYVVTLGIDDIDTEETVEIEVDSITDADDGIGSYEFWGEVGYDSHPYYEVEGTLTQACTVYCSLYVEAADEPIEIDEEDEEDEEEFFDPDGRRSEMPWDYGKHFDD
jgi:hypothetical protein